MVRYPPGAELWGEPLATLRRIQDEINRAFGDQRWVPSSEFPPINVWRGQDGVIVTAEVPGIKLDAIDLTVHQNTLTIKGTPRARGARAGSRASIAASAPSGRSRAPWRCPSTSMPTRSRLRRRTGF